MVVFTCNNCGESLQKPKVEKHYSTVCRTFKNLTCVDCLKDFKEEDYVAHIKCVSEKERYAAKGTVISVVNKGEVKQQQWSDMILEIINIKTNLTSPQKIVFEIMSNHIINVPRKKMKFMNFIKNAGGNRIMYEDIENVWDMIEEHKAAQDKNEIKTENDITTEETNVEDNVESPKKKKKKSKECKKEEPQNDEDKPESKKRKMKSALENSETTENPEENLVKSKKKKSKTDADVASSLEKTPEETVKSTTKKRKSKNASLEVTETEGTGAKVSPAKKKKNKRRSKNGTSNNSLLEPINFVQGETEFQNTNKPVQSVVNGNFNEDDQKKEPINGSHQENGKVDSPKKKKKKNEETNSSTKENDENANITIDSVTEVGASNGDSLSDRIVKLLKKKGVFSVGKLQKKVLKKYCQETGTEETPKLVKKFNKLLKKIEGVEITDDNVRLLQV